MTASIKLESLKQDVNYDFTEGYLKRFSGIGRLYGYPALNTFLSSHFCVIGIGGVGSWIAESLVRTGIGAITLIDLDEICLTNTNRQIHALKTTIGQSKVEVMKNRLLEINPECKITIIEDFVTLENIAEIFSADFDYVFDAIDSVKIKAGLLAYCKRNKIRVISIGGAGGQIDPTQIQIGDIGKTIQDPLAAKVRSLLKSNYKLKADKKGRLGIDCIYSTEQLRYPQTDGTVCFDKGQTEGSMRMDCSSGFGAVTMVTASFGFFAVSHALKKILK